MHIKRHTCIRRLGIPALLLLLAALLIPGTTMPAEARSTGVAVVVWPTPSIRVARGDILTYEVVAKNFSRDAHTNIRVFLPYDQTQITIVGAEFEDPAQDWVSELSGAHVLVSFRELEGGESRTATIYARVANDLPDDTIINMWPSYSWNHNRSQRNALSSNAAPVLVGAANEHSPFVWMNVEPDSGSTTDTYRFFSNRFVAGETIDAVLVAQGRTDPIETYVADADTKGQLWLNTGGEALPPGTYELFARGRLSDLQGVATFTVAAP